MADSITTKAINDARLLNYTRSDIIDIVGELQQSHFVKSAPGNNGQPGNWHDAYNYYDQVGGIVLYVKFAGTSIIDITLTSFKEK